MDVIIFTGTFPNVSLFFYIKPVNEKNRTKSN